MSIYEGLPESEFSKAVDMVNRFLFYSMGGRPNMARGVCEKCGRAYEGRRIIEAFKCGEVLPCEHCGGAIMPDVESELPEAMVEGAL